MSEQFRAYSKINFCLGDLSARDNFSLSQRSITLSQDEFIPSSMAAESTAARSFFSGFGVGLGEGAGGMGVFVGVRVGVGVGEGLGWGVIVGVLVLTGVGVCLGVAVG